jgi:hypothetical protein
VGGCRFGHTRQHERDSTLLESVAHSKAHLAAEVEVKNCSVERLGRQQRQGFANRGYGADHDRPSGFQPFLYIDGDEVHVLHHQESTSSKLILLRHRDVLFEQLRAEIPAANIESFSIAVQHFWPSIAPTSNLI